MTEDLEEDLRDMCNLGEGIYEYGIEIGQARGEEIGQARGEEIGQARGEEIGQARGEEIGQARGITKTLTKLVEKGRITVEEAADEMGITPLEFREKYLSAAVM